MAAQRAELLICCYRKDDAANPEIFASALVAIFCGYPESIVRKVSDPRTGIPGKQKWFPSIAEIRHECEVEAQKIKEASDWHARENDRAMGLLPPEIDRVAILAKIRAQYPEVFDRKRKERESERVEAVDTLNSAAKLAYWRSPLVLSDAARETMRR